MRARRSISDRFACSTSDALAAVRIANSRARAADAFLLAQLTHEGGNVAEGHRGVMLDRSDLFLGRIDRVEVSFPSGGIFAVAEALRLRPIETFSMRPRTRDAVVVLVYQIGSSTCLIFCVPGRPDNCATGMLPIDRVDVLLQRSRPLLGVLDVAPSGLVRLDILLGTFSEC